MFFPTMRQDEQARSLSVGTEKIFGESLVVCCVDGFWSAFGTICDSKNRSKFDAVFRTGGRVLSSAFFTWGGPLSRAE